MKTLINVIIRFHFVFLFIILEIISIRMVIFEDLEKKNAYFSSANTISGFFYKRLDTWSAYFSLAHENEMLRAENLELRSIINTKKQPNQLIKSVKTDTSATDSVKYKYIPARVINNSIYKKQNYITLDKGFADGINKDFGVVSAKGIVGIVVAVSEHYSLVASILNNRLGLGVKIKKSHHFGSVHWLENNYRYASLLEIPNHIKIAKGDTIVSSGFSSIFPEGINIGTIAEFKTNQSNNFYEISIKLSNDFKSLYNVYAIDNSMRREQISLENKVEDEY